MENYGYSSSYPDTGDSSPRSREIECDSAAATAGWDDLPPPRVKLMCSYGGRIQPRSRDNQLAYVGGDTKIIAVDHNTRLPSFLAKLALLYGSEDVILKYQLPGEDLDALISVTNDEDLEHMMIEYDRLHRLGSRPVARLRLFLFPAMGKGGSQDRAKLADVSPPVVTSVSPTMEGTPDFLFGFDKGFVPPPAVKVMENEPVVENVGSEAVPVKSEPEPVTSPMVEELHKPQIAVENNNNQQQLEPQLQPETLPARDYPPQYYVHQIQKKAPEQPTEPAAALPQSYWPAPPPSARFASIVSGDQQFFLIPANSGVFAAGQGPGGYYATRMIPAYTMAPPAQHQGKQAYNSGVRGLEVYDNGAGYPAYDSAGRAVYYTGTAPAYQTVDNVALAAAEPKVLKPSQVS